MDISFACTESLERRERLVMYLERTLESPSFIYITVCSDRPPASGSPVPQEPAADAVRSVGTLGLLMNSEVWVCLTDEERCLPFALAEQGYDVWVGDGGTT